MKQIRLKSNRKRTLKGRLAVICILFGLMLAAGPAAAQQGPQDQPAEEIDPSGGHVPAVSIRATDMVGREVQNKLGKQIAVIDDLIIDGKGRIQQIVLSVGGYLGIGDKLVAVNFDELEFQTRWTYRTIRTQQGIEEKVAWERHLTVLFAGSEDELRAQVGYTYSEENQRGGSTGWGVYSGPAGPKKLKEVP